MSALVEALQRLGLQGEVSRSGRWIKLQGERSQVYVVAAVWGTRYFSWCADPNERVVEVYSDPTEAIEAGLKRAARGTQSKDGSNP